MEPRLKSLLLTLFGSVKPLLAANPGYDNLQLQLASTSTSWNPLIFEPPVVFGREK